MNAVFVDTGYLFALEITNTDCISFLAMQKLGIRRAFAFDQHFVQAGFTKEP